MNRNLIEKAVRSYLLQCEDHTEKEECISALLELACVAECDEAADAWHNECVMLPATAWDGLLNTLTYDILGKACKLHGENMQEEFYYHDCKQQVYGLECVPKVYLRYGYEILLPLWKENEAEGSNKEDGSYNG